MTREIKSARLSDGLTLPYVERGEDAGVPMVFLHAFADSWRSFERLLPYLPASVHAFAVTQRGHGDADRPASGYGVEEFAADVAAFMDAVGLKAAVWSRAPAPASPSSGSRPTIRSEPWALC